MDEDPRLDPFLSGPLSRLAIDHRAWVLAQRGQPTRPTAAP